MKLSVVPKTIFCVVLLLEWESCLQPATAQPNASWLYVSIRALPQTVEVQTHRGSYLAVFQLDAQVYADGSGNGSLRLTQTDGTELNFQVVAGRAQVRGEGGAGRITGIAVDPADPTGNALVFQIHPAPASEPCRIYDIAGTQVHAQFEAETEIAVIRN